MLKANIVVGFLALGLLVGCEREVVGETFEGQKNGGRSLRVTGSAPPRGATSSADAPAELPPAIGGHVSLSDPSTRGLLLASGQTRSRSPRRPSLRGSRPPAGLQAPMPMMPVPQPNH